MTGNEAAAGAAASAEKLLQMLCAERTEHGFIILPDQAGSGPMYVAVLYKH